MARLRRGFPAVAAGVFFSLLCCFVVNRWAPHPSADSARASEEAFARGLEEREFVPPMMGPGRWTSGGATFRFQHLPQGPATLEVRVRNHQNAVRVLADRRSLGVISVGDRGRDFDMELTTDAVRIDLVVKPFLARGGRRLGTFLDRVTLAHARSILPPLDLLWLFATPALIVGVASLVAGASRLGALAAPVVSSSVQALLLWPHGIVRSGYVEVLVALLAAGSGIIALVSRRRPWLFGSLLVAFFVHGVAAIHPLVIGLDASFHGHNLADVLAGNYFLVSETQHRPPFEFPYGVTFYLPLVPFVRSGLGLVESVRIGGAIAGLIGSTAVFWLLSKRGDRLAAAGVIVLQLVPWTFIPYSNGNYSNVFAQAAVLLFFVWWTSGKPLGWPVGALAFAIGALGHFSSFFFLLALTGALLLVHRDDVRRMRTGLTALGVGLLVTFLYYAQFSSLISAQLPRFLAGGSGGAGTETLVGSVLAQLRAVLSGWGLPVVVLAFIGRPRGEAMADDLRAFWLAGGLLALAAITTPLEVRYLYALTFPLAVAAATGLEKLLSGGLGSKIAAWGLAGAQTWIGLARIAEALLRDWRA